MKLNSLFTHILTIAARLFWPLFVVLVVGAFLVMPAFAQDGTPPQTSPDLSNLQTLLNYLSGPGAVIVVGLLVSRLAESWQWWSNLSRDSRVALSSATAAILAVAAYALGKYLLTLPVETMAQVQVYFQIVFVAVSGVIGQNIFHAVVNKPLSTPKT